jgi:hypothetical protein
MLCLKGIIQIIVSFIIFVLLIFVANIGLPIAALITTSTDLGVQNSEWLSYWPKL